MADDELDAVADEFVGDGHALLGVGHVVAQLDLDLLSENAAGLVDVFGGLLDALGQLGAKGGVGPGDRSGDGEFDLRLRCTGEPQRQRDGDGLQNGCSHINLLCEFDRLACGH